MEHKFVVKSVYDNSFVIECECGEIEIFDDGTPLGDVVTKSREHLNAVKGKK